MRHKPTLDGLTHKDSLMGAESPSQPGTARLVSLDAYRGFIMLAMVSGGFAFSGIARKYFPDDELWKTLGYQFDHATWEGGGFWDMIQPSFMFMVGVAMPYSHASRVAKGQSPGLIAAHVIYRSLLLIALGVFLSSNWDKQTNFTFVNVLSQIGLGYAFVYMLIGRGAATQLAALVVILGGYWLWFLAYPAPPIDFDYATVGFGPNKFLPYPFHPYDGLFTHWNPNVNAASNFDHWFLNLFPREKPFEFNTGGYATLNFIPSMATMIFGLMAGEMLRRHELLPREKLLRLVIAAAVCLGVGYLLGQTVCPLVKRIWTPSWAIYSTGWTIDIKEYRELALPLVVVGMNSIAVYVMAQLLKPWVRDTLKRHLGQHVFEGTYFGHEMFMPLFAPVAESVGFLLVLWLVAAWMYRQKIFVKI
jgi:predicted acyltransferase